MVYVRRESRVVAVWTLLHAREPEEIKESLGRRVDCAAWSLGISLHAQELAPDQLVQDGPHRFASKLVDAFAVDWLVVRHDC